MARRSDLHATEGEGAERLRRHAEEAGRVLQTLPTLGAPLDRAVHVLGTALRDGRKLLACGNGGSSADGAHFTAEIAGRYERRRAHYPAVDLTASAPLLTALGNDYAPDEVFARALRAHAHEGDVLAAFSTSGNSANVRQALEAAGELGVTRIAFLGGDGGACAGLAEIELRVPAGTTARVQEAHLLLYHTICEALEHWL